MEVALVVSFVM